MLIALLPLSLVIAGCGGSPESFEKEKVQIRKKALAKAKAKARGNIRKDVAAREIGLQTPVTGVTASRDELKQQVVKRVQEEVEEEFPPLKPATLEKEAEEKYPAKEIGEKVEFIIRGGRGSDPTLEGAFMDITDQRVKIGNRWVLKKDMKEEDLVLFDKEFREKLRKKYVLIETERHRNQRQNFIEARRQEFYEQALIDAGYQKWRGVYVDASRVLAKEIEERVEKKADRTAPDIERKMLENAGFVLKDGQWKPSLMKRLF